LIEIHSNDDRRGLSSFKKPHKWRSQPDNKLLFPNCNPSALRVRKLSTPGSPSFSIHPKRRARWHGKLTDWHRTTQASASHSYWVWTSPQTMYVHKLVLFWKHPGRELRYAGPRRPSYKSAAFCLPSKQNPSGKRGNMAQAYFTALTNSEVKVLARLIDFLCTALSNFFRTSSTVGGPFSGIAPSAVNVSLLTSSASMYICLFDA